MPQSQLKRLKASLRTAGVTGPQKPKKAKKRDAAGARHDPRLKREAALTSIREEFNPFEIKTTREKHTVINGRRVKGREGRPAISKSIGEENRKRTLLVEMNRRGKVGGIVDRRFGENDPTMAPEDRMLERFAREKTARVRSGDGLFNLDDDTDLTHFGQSLGGLRDDFDGPALSDDESDGGEGPTLLSRKRLLEEVDAATGSGEEDEDGDKKPERKKSKAEVMKEVMSKSKLFKYERQKAKEEDEDEREKLDAEMGELWSLLGARQPSTTGAGSGANNVPLGVEAAPEEKRADEYDQAVREMLFDKRSKPSDKSKTDEEKAAEESERLKALEEARLRRMNGEEVTDDEDDGKKGKTQKSAVEDEDEEQVGDGEHYGLGAGIPMPARFAMPDHNPDELVDGDYEVSDDGYVDVDEDGELQGDYSDDFEAGSDAEISAAEDSEDDDFLADVKPDSSAPATGADALAYTFPCPQTHAELLSITAAIAPADHPTVVQRIRVLHHSNLAAGNKEKLAVFSGVLLQHIAHLANLTPAVSFTTLDLLIRHLHAMAKTHGEAVASAVREHLKDLHTHRLNADLNAGDLVVLTAVGTIFSTSDAFHPVATPALILICKYLSTVLPSTPRILATGTYLVSLVTQYQRTSKRFVPEALNFVLQALSLLAPTPLAPVPGWFPYHDTAALRLKPSADQKSWTPRKLAFAEIFAPRADTPLALTATLSTQLAALATLWTGRRAFTDAFTPAVPVLSHLTSTRPRLPSALRKQISATSTTLAAQLAHAAHTRRPLELHHHRPLPIPSAVPKFDSDYNPDSKSRDPDVDRRESAKLRAEHKRERKGAMRELRKDSHFVSRVKMAADKESSRVYHKKMAKLHAQIQTEEGAAGNEYKRMRARK
ncbi:nucleolar protein 14 [Geopyxis carbonaria]|nr:nucleolar protein 14 [Geopyxis carbonaria]